MKLVLRSMAAVALVVLLGACGHARVVRIDGDGPRSSPSRPAARATAQTYPMRPSPQAIPRDGIHVVQSGESLYGIAFRYGLRYQDVAAWNRLDDASVIEVGQLLRLRPPSVASATPPAPTPRSAVAPSVAPPPVPSPAPSVVATAPATVAPPPPRSIAPAPAQAPMANSGAPHWRWPTAGQLVGRFVAGDPTQQGIDIAGTAGQPVLAAADGVVVYSGAGLVGYGELIIVKHNDQWLSAYAHNRKRLVAEGARVKAGDAIAELGRSGAPRDMLHFEIRLNGKPVDPLQFLPTR